MTTETAEQASGKKSIWGNIIKLVVFLGIGIFFIYWFLLKLDSGQKQAIWNSFVEADYAWIAIAIGVSLLSHIVRALRWNLLFEPLNIHPRLNNTFGAVMVAYLSNLAFPRLGEVMRCAMLRTSDNIPIEKSLGTVVTERIIDTISFGIIAVVGIIIMFSKVKDWLYDNLMTRFSTLPSMTTLIITAVVVVVVLLVCYKLFYKMLLRFAFVRKIDDLVRGCIDGLKSIFHLKPHAVILFVVYSCIIYFLYILGGYVIFKALPETATLGFAAAFVLYLFGSIGMIISQGGLGAYPVLVWQALAIYGIGQSVGLASGWLLWSSQQALVVVVGLIYFVYFSLTKKKKQVH